MEEKERKMAETELMEVETKVERKRKPNFSVYEISVITESVPKNLEIIQSKLTNSVTNKKKKPMWKEITKENAVGQANRTVPLSRNFPHSKKRARRVVVGHHQSHPRSQASK